MQKTTNYELNKPEGSDLFDIEHFNQNAEKLDATVKTLSNTVAQNNTKLTEDIQAVNTKVTANESSIQTLNTKVTDLTPLEVTGTLAIGETTLVIENEAITDDKIVDIYSSVYGINPKTVSVEAGKITLTFKEQTEEVIIKVIFR